MQRESSRIPYWINSRGKRPRCSGHLDAMGSKLRKGCEYVILVVKRL